MSTREKLSPEALSAFTSSGSGWSEAPTSAGAPPSIEKTFAFKDYASAVAFVVRVAFAAEKRDHHPDMLLAWGRVRVAWSTHDVGGVTALDVEMAGVTDRLYSAA